MRFAAILILTLSAAPALAGSFTKVELALGEETGCASALGLVRDHLSLDLQGLPASIAAGTAVPFTVRATKSATLKASDWVQEYGVAFVHADTLLPYPKMLRLDQDEDLLGFLFGEENHRTFSFDAKQGAHVDGVFTLHFRLSLVTPEFGYCVVDADYAAGLTVRSKTPDMVPPLLRKIQLDRDSYLPGETVTVRFTFSEPLREPKTDHIEFVNPTLDRGTPAREFPGYLSEGAYELTPVEANVYQISFVVPAEARPGDYFLEWWNRFDRAGNFEDRVGSVDEEEMTALLSRPITIGAR